MPATAVQQAIGLLQSQLEAISPKAQALRAQIKKLEGELAALSAEEDEIKAALTSLGAPFAPPKPGALEALMTIATGVAEGLSVRAAVQKLLEETPRSFESSEVADLVSPLVRPGLTDVRSSVSTALWWLRSKGVITTLENGSHIATKWLPGERGLPEASDDDQTLKGDEITTGGT
jgi:hypothetical protein